MPAQDLRHGPVRARAPITIDVPPAEPVDLMTPEVTGEHGQGQRRIDGGTCGALPAAEDA